MRSTLLAKIEAEAIDRDIVKALRLCLSLGGHTGSPDLREWATRELHGYKHADVPEYRVVYAPLQIDGMAPGMHIKGQQVSTWDLPEFARETITERVELRQSIAGLVDLVKRARSTREPIRLSPPGAPDLVKYMNGTSVPQFHHVERLYWAIAPTAIQEVVDQVRSRLVALVAEMRAGMEVGERIPSADVASQAVSIVINGDGNRVSVKKPSIQQKTVNNPGGTQPRARRALEALAWLAGIGAFGVLLWQVWPGPFGG